jgi:hypothetical protein
VDIFVLNVDLMNNFAGKIQQPGAMKNSHGFTIHNLADCLMDKVQDIHSFPCLKIKIPKPHKVALLYSEYSF